VDNLHCRSSERLWDFLTLSDQIHGHTCHHHQFTVNNEPRRGRSAKHGPGAAKERPSPPSVRQLGSCYVRVRRAALLTHRPCGKLCPPPTCTQVCGAASRTQSLLTRLSAAVSVCRRPRRVGRAVHRNQLRSEARRAQPRSERTTGKNQGVRELVVYSLLVLL